MRVLSSYAKHLTITRRADGRMSSSVASRLMKQVDDILDLSVLQSHYVKNFLTGNDDIRIVEEHLTPAEWRGIYELFLWFSDINPNLTRAFVLSNLNTGKTLVIVDFTNR